MAFSSKMYEFRTEYNIDYQFKDKQLLEPSYKGNTIFLFFRLGTEKGLIWSTQSTSR